jgi:hypothetical protein
MFFFRAKYLEKTLKRIVKFSIDVFDIEQLFNTLVL